MRRSDGALEVRLKHDDGSLHTLVGWLTCYPMFDHRKGSIAIDMVKPLGRAGWTDADDMIDSYGFRLTQMNKIVRKTELERSGPAPSLEQVPWNAIQSEIRVAGSKTQYLYEWKALVVDMPNYELLFDLPDFEAFDQGEPDTDDDVIRARVEARHSRGRARYPGDSAADQHAEDQFRFPGHELQG